MEMKPPVGDNGAQHGPIVDFDPLDPVLADEIWERIAKIHDQCPVAWSEMHGGYWLMSRHEDVWAAAQNWELFSSADGATPVQFDLDIFRMIPLETDPPTHRSVRRVLNPFFTPEALKRTEPVISDLVAELLEECVRRSPCDFVKNFTQALPARVFFGTFLEQTSQSDIGWVLELIDALFTDPDAAFEKIPELGGWCWEIMEERLAEGRRDDLVGAIAHAGLGGEVPLGERERLETLLLVVLAGMETTASALGNIVHQLAVDPKLRAALGAMDGAGVDRSVDELLRYEAPVPTAARTLTRDVEIGGCPMRAGDRVLLNWAGANRDPGFFPDPEVIDLDRPNLGKQMAFGGGLHHCLGTHLARREIRLAIRGICEFSTFELVEGTEITYRPGFARGPKELPIRCSR